MVVTCAYLYYLPRPALLVGGFLAGPADGLTLAFFSTVVVASLPSTWWMPFFLSSAALSVSDSLLMCFLCVVPPERFELPTLCLQSICTTTVLKGLYCRLHHITRLLTNSYLNPDILGLNANVASHGSGLGTTAGSARPMMFHPKLQYTQRRNPTGRTKRN